MNKKLENKIKSGSMVGYIDNGTVVGIEPGWNIKPQALAKLLMDRYPSKEDAMKLVDSAVLVPVFKKDDYEGVESFGDVIDSNWSWNKEYIRKDIGHLFCHMTGVWKYSDNGIDWEPVSEVFEDNSGTTFDGVRDALELQDALTQEVA